jgi:uncharacterized membrane protein HdeD (DUF308 family)
MIDALRAHWWAVGLRGLVSIVLGLVALALPAAAIFALIVWFAAFAIIDGILALVSAFRLSRAHGPWVALFLEGLVGIVAGVVVFLIPALGAFALAYLVAAWAIVTGVLAVLSATRARTHVPNEWLWILSGAVSIVFGVFFAFAPGFGLAVLAYTLGFYALIAGFSLVGLAFRMRRLPPHAPNAPTPV